MQYALYLLCNVGTDEAGASYASLRLFSAFVVREVAGFGLKLDMLARHCLD